MLTGTGFGNDALFTHTPGQQSLTNRIVDFVSTGVVEVFAFQINLRAAQDLAPTLGVINRAGTADKVFQFTIELGNKFRVTAIVIVGMVELFERSNQRFRDKRAAVGAKVTASIGQIVGFHESDFLTAI